MKIKVTTMRPSFRRGGVEFGREPTILDTAELKKAQLEAIQAEPHLNVQVIEEKSAKKDDEKAKKEAEAKAAAEKAKKEAEAKAAAEKAKKEAKAKAAAAKKAEGNN